MQYPEPSVILFYMLSKPNVIFLDCKNAGAELLGRLCGQYLLREFSAWEYTVTDSVERAAELFSEDAVNLILPLDMPLVRTGDVIRAAESMRRKKITCMRLGAKNSEALICFGRQIKGGFFLTGDSFLRVGDTKSAAMVYNQMRERIALRHAEKGVRITDLSSVHIDDTVIIAPDAEIKPFTRLYGSTAIAGGAVADASLIENSIVDGGAKIEYSYVKDSHVRAGACVGPFARLRGADVGEDCRVGDFVEIKASVLKRGVKCAHLTYVGDAEIGEGTNLGCGTVVCNFDGVTKHKTTVGNNCFIGANTNLIAPLSVGDGAFIAAGTTVNRSVESSTFTIGRVRQETKKK